MEHISEQSLAMAIERCQNIDMYRVLVVTKTWQRADYWSHYIADKYNFVFKLISRNKFMCASGSTIRLVSQSHNLNGLIADLVLYDIGLNYEASRALDFMEMKLTSVKLKHVMEEQINDTL